MFLRLLPVILLMAGCGAPTPPSTRTTPDGFTARLIGAPPGLHNVIRVNDWLYTGSEPEGEPGFQSLHDLGILTVITVDGTKPDLEHSAKQGIRYVHVPIGYSAIPRDRVLLIAKAMKDLPKPIYLHCHHGKHRGPAAAMAAIRCLDPSWTSEGGRKFLQFAGTDPEYSELYASVESAQPVAAESLAGIPAYPASAPVPDIVGKMLELDRIVQRLNVCQNQKRPFESNDVVALREVYRELMRESGDRPEDFIKILRNGEEGAKQILAPASPWSALNGFLQVGETCHQCHTRFRNRTPVK